MEDKKLNPMNEESLDEVAGGATNYDFYGNPINSYGPSTMPVAPQPIIIQPAPVVDNGLHVTIKNGAGATYVCPSCNSSDLKIKSADEKNITLQCRKCKTKFTVANV